MSRPSVTQSNQRRTSQKKHEPAINNTGVSHTVELKPHHSLHHSTSNDHLSAIPQPEVGKKTVMDHKKSHPTEEKKEAAL
jgi:hypothetical protein